MAIKVGINGFGRIGRMVFRAIKKDFPELEVVGINDLLDNDYLAYMLKYDTAHGRFDGEVAVDGDHFVVDGKRVRLSAERNPADLKWGDIDVDVAIDCTGFFLTEESCQAHIDAGAKKVVQSAPSKDGTPMFVYGVNHEDYAGQAIVSAASCTTNCLAPNNNVRSYIVNQAKLEDAKITQVFNEITIGPNSGLLSRAKDSAITVQVETLFHDQEVFHPTQVRVMTENQTVYLMGAVTKREADMATKTAAKAKGVKKVVKLFDYLKTRPAAEIERDRQREIAAQKAAELKRQQAELDAQKAELKRQLEELGGTTGTSY